MTDRENWIVTLRDNATGETVEYVDEYDWSDENPYVWEDGNYSCDCNRSLFFQRAKGVLEEVARSNMSECGDKAFTVLEIRLPRGKVIYSEVDDVRPLKKRIVELEAIEQSHRKLNGELQVKLANALTAEAAQREAEAGVMVLTRQLATRDRFIVEAGQWDGFVRVVEQLASKIEDKDLAGYALPARASPPAPEGMVLKEALMAIRLLDWSWAGGGSDVRVPGPCSKLASKALDLPAGFPCGWPSEEERSVLNKALNSSAMLASVTEKEG